MGEVGALHKIDKYQPEIVNFTFKKVARVLFGDFPGNGFVASLNLGDSDVFVMPGPYEGSKMVVETLATLSRRMSP